MVRGKEERWLKVKRYDIYSKCNITFNITFMNVIEEKID